MDIIFIDELRLPTWIGVYDWERQARQTVEISLEIGLPSSKAGESDSLEDTINYAAVVERLAADLDGRHFLLIEALAEHVADVIRSDFGAPWLRLRLSKPGVLPRVKRIGVQIERGRRD